MKFLIVFFLSNLAVAATFEEDARSLAADLKASLMKNLSEKIAQEGPAKAVTFCHTNVKPIAKGAAGERIKRFTFGRTSHKLRNGANAPEPWVSDYLKKFEGKKKGDISPQGFIHHLQDGKKVYVEPLFVEARCLLCHGENISADIKEKISSLYPNDQATGFKLGEFRGFIWVKEK